MKKKVCKVPVIIQMEALECGAASLAMVLAYYGRWIPLSTLREECGVSRDGSSAVNILKAARNYGFVAKGYRCTVEQIKGTLFPAIIHWNYNHFVVLDGFEEDCAVINDPARGIVKVPLDEFEKAFTGVALCFRKTEAFVPGGSPERVLDFVKSKLKGTATAFAFILATAFITQALGIVKPLFLKVFLDNILGQGRYDWLRPLLFLMAVVLLMQLANDLINNIYSLKIKGKLSIISSTNFMWHVLRLPMRFFTQRYAGDISNRQNYNERIAETLMNQLAPMALNSVMIVFYLCIMLYYSPVLTAIGIATIGLNIQIARYVSKRRVEINRKKMRSGGSLSAVTMTGIEMIETLKASGAEDGFFEKWAGYQANINNADVENTKINQFLGLLPETALQISNGMILTLGACFIIQGHFTIGTLMAFQSYMGSFMAPVNGLIGVMQGVQEMRTSMERINDVMDYEPDIIYKKNAETEALDYTKLSGRVEIKNLTFGYNKYGPPLIENFSMNIKKGSKVAFVGASGCGKSTLAKLVSNLYQPWSGDILFDEKKAAEINRVAFTNSISVVDQNIILFNDTIRDNVTMWDKFASDSEVLSALHDAQIYEDVMCLEGGLDHQVLEGGRNFSGGQRQRFEIARALVTDPSILILDEATSALDAKTEGDVMEAIDTRGITCIVIAHRLSTIRDCDEIVVFDKGAVVERGTHDALYSKNGYYTKLISSE